MRLALIVATDLRVMGENAGIYVPEIERGLKMSLRSVHGERSEMELRPLPACSISMQRKDSLSLVFDGGLEWPLW